MRVNVGLMSGSITFGRAIGTLYILFFPPKKPKLQLLIACSFTFLFTIGIPYSKIFGDYQQIAILVLAFLSGIVRCYVMIPLILLSEYLNPNEHKF